MNDTTNTTTSPIAQLIKGNQQIASAKTFASHAEILDFIQTAVTGNMEGQEYMHGREILDDVLDDLIRYRSSLESIDAYVKANKL